MSNYFPVSPKYQVAILGFFAIPFLFASGITGDLTTLAIGSVLGYGSQYLFALHTTQRKSWELLFAMGIIAFSVMIGYPSIQFLSKAIFALNAQITAWKILCKIN